MSRRGRAVLDAAGGVLALVLVATAFLVARDGGEASAIAGLVAAASGALVVGRLVGLVHRAPVPFVAVLTAFWLAVGVGGITGSGPLGGPFGYRNATGAFFAQAAIAALMAGFAFRAWGLRLVGVAVAVPCAAVAAIDSAAAGLSLLVLVPVVPVLAGWSRSRAAIVAIGTLFALVLAGTVALGTWYRPGVEGPIVRALTERRLTLWSESLELMAEHPAGVGPGRFAEVAPTALEDQDARWAHQEFLEQGAELGWAGFTLMVALFLWGFVRLWAHPSPDAVVALGAAALGALALHASVDYVLHFPAVPIAAAALLGTAQAAPIRRFRRAERHDRDEGVESAAHAGGVAGAPAPR